MKHQKNIADKCFAACAASPRLLDFFPEAARRETFGGLSPIFNFSAGCHFRDGITSLMSQNILTRHEIFRGKVSRRQKSKHKPKLHLEERTRQRQNPMSNPNPFVPKGSLLEQQSQRRSRLKLAVFCVLAISVTGLVAMLIQGCKRTPQTDDTGANSTLTDSNSLPTDAGTNSLTDTNLPPAGTNQQPVYTPPPPPPPVDVQRRPRNTWW